MQEIWKNIPGYEEYYQVSNYGKIRSLHKKKSIDQPYYELKPTLINSGYYHVTLYSPTQGRHKMLVHKIVAQVFIPNPDKLPCVNHKDENKLNNSADNLEWCTYAYNNAYGTAKIRSIEKISKPINQFTLQGTWIATYQSASVASKLLNICKTDIHYCCKKKLETAGGYIWEYAMSNSKQESHSQNPTNHNNLHSQ